MGKKAERGNVLEIVIIAVLVLAVVGLVVWRFIDGNKTKTEDSSKQTSSQTADTDTTPTGDTNTMNPNAGYIVIEEWGIRFKVTGAAQYEYAKMPSGSYGFSTAVLNSLGQYCTAVFGAGGIVDRRTTVNSEDATGWGEPLNGGKPINGYYYFLQGPQAACADDKSDFDVEVGQSNLTLDLIRTIEAKQ